MKFVEFQDLKEKYDVINIGSGPSKNDFDWSVITEVDGYNFAVAPEDFRYDARIVKNYGKYVNKGGAVVIVICPLSFAENAYLQEDFFSYKYVKALPPEDVDIPLWKYFILKIPLLGICIINARRAINIPCHVINHFVKKRKIELPCEEKLVYGWLRDNPCLKNLKDIPDVNLSEIFERKVSDLRNVVKECRSHSLIPIFLLPPVSKKLKSFFSEDFLDLFVYKNIGSVDDTITLLDYMQNEQFNDDNYFSNGLFLKKEYVQLFTRDVLKRINIFLNRGINT